MVQSRVSKAVPLMLALCSMALGQLNQNCTVSVLSGCTHSVLWEATDRVRSSLVDFCQKLREAAGNAFSSWFLRLPVT